MKYRLTDTHEDAVSNRSKIEQIKCLAYEALGRLKPETVAPYRTIHKWTGKHTIIRVGPHAITLETVP